jgi:hypothetical protein
MSRLTTSQCIVVILRKWHCCDETYHPFRLLYFHDNTKTFYQSTSHERDAPEGSPLLRNISANDWYLKLNMLL